MILRPEDQANIRQYLLGGLTDEEQRRQVEERLLTDDEYFEELSVTEDELVDEYLGGALSEVEREQFEGHFLSTPERRRKLRFGQALEELIARGEGEGEQSTAQESQPRPAARESRPRRSWWRALSARPLRAATAFALVVFASGVAWRAFYQRSDADEGLAALAAAYRGRRPTEARITGFGYAPHTVTRGGEADGVDRASRDRAELLLLKAARERPGPASLHALGRLYLAEKRLDMAVEQLEAALKTAPDDARLRSDLGAALLEAGDAERQAGDPGGGSEKFARALEHLDRALELDDSLLEALFNRALCYQYVLQLPQAEADWRKYLEKDPASPWAGEARRNLDRVEELKKQRASRGQKEQLFGEETRQPLKQGHEHLELSRPDKAAAPPAAPASG